jgi:hypothetical protein
MKENNNWNKYSTVLRGWLCYACIQRSMGKTAVCEEEDQKHYYKLFMKCS